MLFFLNNVLTCTQYTLLMQGARFTQNTETVDRSRPKPLPVHAERHKAVQNNFLQFCIKLENFRATCSN